ncbi:MAG: outer membrane protein assembly factor BamD [Dokdonella sp.]|uniref:outer membrane protein assembly factor BamD n=1 Tax=Dokdonella sp. TaxID=2291710 RepID=UPI0025C708A8|nr:outer membrane protein assembly factor BamD [Dokdonella sp.]MBX3700930.1 outer membrane protein assembly factor BamD [Dokdonella sp.]MCW5578659.1 outer membrane protein assembly factor BamD [Dokdonella sp.]
MRVPFRTTSILRLALVVLLALLAGCSLFNRGAKKGDAMNTMSVEELYAQGATAIDNRNYDLATRSFQRLISRFPFGAYTEQAQLNLAYAQYKSNKPDDAYSTVNRFIKTYPTHRHVDYAYYLRGLVNFNRSGGFLERYVGQDMTKRDQANLRQSFDDFGALITRYPNSGYAADARQRMIALRNTMAQSELHIAFYYYKRQAYVAASNRAKDIIETYPQTPQVADALAIMYESYARLGQQKLADDAKRVLELNYPEHPALRGKWPHYRSTWWKLIPLSNRG